MLNKKMDKAKVDELASQDLSLREIGRQAGGVSGESQVILEKIWEK